MSLFHRSAHAEAWPEKSLAQPALAACWDAEIADCSGVEEVKSVSTPTNFVNSYVLPLRASKVTAWLVVSPDALFVAEVDVGWMPVLSVEAPAPVFPVAVSKATSTVCDF